MSGADDILPEADLAVAVVAQALADGCANRSRRVQSGNGMKAMPHDRAEAWAFLTDRAGGWAAARAAWCGICGVDPEILRQEALRRGPWRDPREAA